MYIIEIMRFPIVSFIFLGLFLVASILQLVLAFTEKHELRKKEKPACMFFLGIALIFAFPKEPLLYTGAFLGMIGDILVLKKNTFIPGAGAFFLGHICYIIETLWKVIKFHNTRFTDYVILVVVYLSVFIVVYQICNRNKEHTKFDICGQAVYFSILAVYIPLFALATIFKNNYMLISLFGAIVFIISDLLLVITHFGRKFKRYDFYIMFTYLLAELLIISGITLSLIY